MNAFPRPRSSIHRVCMQKLPSELCPWEIHLGRFDPHLKFRVAWARAFSTFSSPDIHETSNQVGSHSGWRCHYLLYRRLRSRRNTRLVWLLSRGSCRWQAFLLSRLLALPTLHESLASAAAGIQASIGAVSAGSLFAILQSLTMGGVAFATVQAIATGLGVVTGLAAAYLGITGWMQGK
jgi:hypothetical protein